MNAPEDKFDVVIVGGSYAGLSAAMSLGRSLRRTLIIDSGKPCNRFAPKSYNFITHDGHQPHDIANKAKAQTLAYPTVEWQAATVDDLSGSDGDFSIYTIATDGSRQVYRATKVLFATGVRDLLPDLPGFAESWGKSVIHCPYCHGYEVRGAATGILANGEIAFEMCKLIHNWTDRLTLFTNGKSQLSNEQKAHIERNSIDVVETKLTGLKHEAGYLGAVELCDGSSLPITALYAHLPFEQHCPIPEKLGCELTEAGYLTVDFFNQASVAGIYAAGDCTTFIRSVAYATADGNKAGALLNKMLAEEEFLS